MARIHSQWSRSRWSHGIERLTIPRLETKLPTDDELSCGMIIPHAVEKELASTRLTYRA